MSQTKSDEEIMLEVRNGNEELFEELVERHQDWAWSVAYRFLGDAAQAEDLVQDVFVKVFEARDNYEPSARFRTYLQRIITRTCIDRDRKRNPVYSHELANEKQSFGDPYGDLIGEELDSAIRKAIGSLPSRQRMALILKYYHDLSYGEIADRMDCTEKAVESLLGRARDSFKKKIPDWVGKQMDAAARFRSGSESHGL